MPEVMVSVCGHTLTPRLVGYFAAESRDMCCALSTPFGDHVEPCDQVHVGVPHPTPLGVATPECPGRWVPAGYGTHTTCNPTFHQFDNESRVHVWKL